MIVVSFKNIGRHTVEVSTIGHANYAEHGKDIVCSAVSSVFVGLMNEITRYTKSKCRAEPGDAVLKIQTPNNETQVLMEYALHTIKDIAEAYPDNVIVTTE